MSRNTEANSSEAAQAKRREFAAHEKTDDLIAAAIAVRAMAYAPYSDHPVGAAVVDEQDRIHTGCNVENAASPEGTCAEAGAISAMIAAAIRHGSKDAWVSQEPVKMNLLFSVRTPTR